MESSEEITTETMKQILKEIESDSSITVIPPVTVDELCKDNHGGSCLYRVSVRYKKEDVDQSQHTLTLVIKVVPRNAHLAAAVEKTTIFPREIQMFQVVLPRMSALLSQALGDRHNAFCAQAYYSQKSPRYLIAIEDLALKGYKPLDECTSLDLKHCLLALRMLARFHAASVMIHHEDDSLFNLFDVYCMREELAKLFFVEIIKKIHPVVGHTVQSLPEFGHAWAERVSQRYKTLYEDMDDIWKREMIKPSMC